MPTEGYIRKKPDGDWWMEQIKLGEGFRKEYAYQKQWDEWRRMYRGHWKSGVMPVNLFFSLMRTMVPRIYFRDPRVSIAPTKPGFLNMAFARILERIDNRMLAQMKVKKHMKRIIQDSFMFGTGFGKLGFGSIFTPTPLDEEDPISRSGDLLEYNMELARHMPWFSRAHPGTIILPVGLQEFEHAEWIAHHIIRPVEDVRADPRFENTKNLKAGRRWETPLNATLKKRDNLVEMYEIRHKKTGKAFVISPNMSGDNKVLFYDDDRMQIYGGVPFFPVIFNDDDEVFWGVPDSQILEPYQLEINEIKTQIMKHRRIVLVKLLVQQNKMEPEEAAKLVSEDVAAVAWVKGNLDEAVKVIQGSDIPQALFVSAESVMRDVRESVGFSRNQFGEFNSRTADTTATEANIVKAASEIRVDERRDMMADVLVEVVERMHGVIFDLWTEEEVIDVVGPGGMQLWVAFKGSDLRAGGRYNVKVDPDSGVPETRQVKEARAVQLYGLLQQNPFVDPLKLTQYLISEFKGSQFDDIMKLLPGVPMLSGEGITPANPISPQQFGSVIQRGLQSANENGLQQPTLPSNDQGNGTGS